MKNLLALLALLALTGCSTKNRDIELAGMFLSSSTVAIGSVEVIAEPKGEETATIKYSEDTAWLSPGLKTRDISVRLTGTNAVSSARYIVPSICAAFVAVDAHNFVGLTSPTDPAAGQPTNATTSPDR